MEVEERTLIANLLEAEESASALVAEAYAEAEKILAQARAQADSDYEKKFREMDSSLEADYEKKIQELNAGHSSALESYRERIRNVNKNTDAFYEFLQSVL